VLILLDNSEFSAQASSKHQHPIVAAAYELEPLIREKRLEGEKQAHLAKEVVDACGQAGLFRIAAPKEVGGLELLPPDVFAVTEIVGRSDPAVAWYIDNSMAACLTSAFLGAKEREALFENPNVNFGFGGMPTGRALPVDGGYTLSGKWPVVTGVDDAEWAALVAMIWDGDTVQEKDGAPDARTFLVRTKDLEISNSWANVTAMRNTGSNAASAPDVFVPAGFVVAPDQPLVIDRPYFRLPILAHQCAAIGGAVLGPLAVAIESVISDLSKHTAAFTDVARKDQPVTQEFISGIDATYRAFRAGMVEVAKTVGHKIASGEEITELDRARLYGTGFKIFEVGRDLASQLYARGTRAAFVRDHPVDQALRDLHALAYTQAGAGHIVQSSGRVLLGGEHDPGL
jgi:alkylation response protein AidB-like acyl-CoA dehydrogenase